VIVVLSVDVAVERFHDVSTYAHGGQRF